MTRRLTPPALLLALMIAGLLVWQCGCIRTQPASALADEEPRNDPFEKPLPDDAAAPVDDPFADDPDDPFADDPASEPPDDPFGAGDPFAEEDPFGGNSDNPFAEDAAADDPAGVDPFNDDPFGTASLAAGGTEPADVNPFAEVPEAAKQRAPRISKPVPALPFFAAPPQGQAGTAEAAIRKALDEPISLELVDTPLADVAAALRDKCTINVAIDRMAMYDVGVNPRHVWISVHVAGVPLRSALERMFRERDLTWSIRDETLLITTPEDVEMNLVTRVYDVAELVTFRDEQGELWEDHLMLEDAITDTVAPESWDNFGGPGIIRGITLGRAKVLVVTQTEPVHRQVAELLEDLRTRHLSNDARKPPGDGRPPVKKRRSQYRGHRPYVSIIPVVG